MKFSQKQRSKRCEFELKEDSISVKLKTISATKEWDVKLEALGDQTVTIRNTRKLAIFFSIFSALFGIYIIVINLSGIKHTLEPEVAITIGLIYMLIGWILSLIPSTRTITIVGGQQSLSFFLDSPSEEEVRKFIELIITRSKEVILEKYGMIDPDLPEEKMMNQLNWLRNQNIITESKYQDLKTEYKTRKLLNL